MIWVPTLPLLGFGFAHWDFALVLRNGGAMLAVFAAWLLLHAGAMWLNAGLDRDQGEVLLGRPVPVPDGIERHAYLALIAAVLLASAGGMVAGLCALACAGMAVGYSHPATAWKGHPVGGVAVNLLGYGLLSPLAGFSLVGVPLSPRALGTGALVALCVLGSYFVAQAFQEGEDRQRGYRTLVVTHGPRVTLLASRAAFVGAFGLAFVFAAVGWYPRTCLLALPAFIAVERHLVRWAAAGAGSEADARALVHRLVFAGGLLVATTWAAYLHADWSGGPVAGLATASGHPSALLPLLGR